MIINDGNEVINSFESLWCKYKHNVALKIYGCLCKNVEEIKTDVTLSLWSWGLKFNLAANKWNAGISQT